MLRFAFTATALLGLAACGPGTGGTAGADAGEHGRDGGASQTGDGGYPDTGDDLDEAFGCGGVFNPEQILELQLAIAAGDWAALKADTSNSISCGAKTRPTRFLIDDLRLRAACDTALQPTIATSGTLPSAG